MLRDKVFTPHKEQSKEEKEIALRQKLLNSGRKKKIERTFHSGDGPPGQSLRKAQKLRGRWKSFSLSNVFQRNSFPVVFAPICVAQTYPLCRTVHSQSANAPRTPGIVMSVLFALMVHAMHIRTCVSLTHTRTRQWIRRENGREERGPGIMMVSAKRKKKNPSFLARGQSGRAFFSLVSAHGDGRFASLYGRVISGRKEWFVSRLAHTHTPFASSTKTFRYSLLYSLFSHQVYSNTNMLYF